MHPTCIQETNPRGRVASTPMWSMPVLTLSMRRSRTVDCTLVPLTTGLNTVKEDKRMKGTQGPYDARLPTRCSSIPQCRPLRWKSTRFPMTHKSNKPNASRQTLGIRAHFDVSDVEVQLATSHETLILTGIRE